MNPLIGKTITAVHLAADRKAIKFDVVDGEPIVTFQKKNGEQLHDHRG